MLYKRKSGILYPIQSFYKNQKYDIFIGDWGNTQVIDLIKNMGFKILQILPINPICKISYSPYSGNSAFGFEYLFISVDKLVETNFIEEKEVNEILTNFVQPEDFSKIYYNEALEFKRKVLEKAFKKAFYNLKDKLDEFVYLNKWCLFYSIYNALKELENGKPWYQWEENLKNYPLKLYNNNLNSDKLFSEIEERYYFHVFIQYICWKQYLEFKNYANSRGILIFGDIPIYVSHDSVDVWVNREIFKLRDDGYPEFVAGVPPDYFSPTGQLWGNPVYNWDKLKEQEFEWWIRRLEFSFKVYDWVRIDHFRGLVAFWQIPSSSVDATTGQWVEGKPYELFDKLLDYFPTLPIIAEDLGIITPDVEKFRDSYGIPGMRVLQFAFSDPLNIHLPHNYLPNTVAYTGTHDNNTTKGWFKNENKNMEFLINYIGKYFSNYQITEDNIVEFFISLLFGSVANLVVLPIQDVLNLDEHCRMNTPGTNQNNWVYRDNLLNQKTEILIPKFHQLNKTYKR